MVKLRQILGRELLLLRAAIGDRFHFVVYDGTAVEATVERYLSTVGIAFSDGTSDMLAGLTLAAKYNPEDTFVLSDGCDMTHGAEAAAFAGRMTGRVHAFYAAENPAADDYYAAQYPIYGRRLMQEIARVSGGTFTTIMDGRGIDIEALRRGLKTEQGEAPMSKRQLPDHFLDGQDEFEFVAPESAVVDLRKYVRIITGTVFEQEHRAPEWLPSQGQAVRQTIQAPGSQITAHAPQGVQHHGGFWSRMVSNLGSMAPLPAPQQASATIQDRGQIVDATYEPVHQSAPALPPPQRQTQSALPAPQTQPVAALPAPSGQDVPMPRTARRGLTYVG